ncbi:SRA-YDG domain-containing protein [Lasiodiplodia theobromae]|nr:SRA-YDG domain-containing protein [Lasiodiplodia theobromae]
MAPPAWVSENRLTPEERKQLARERVTEILEKQAREAKDANMTIAIQPSRAPAVQSPSTPILGEKKRRRPSGESASESTDSSDLHAPIQSPPKRIQPTWYTSIPQKKLKQASGKRDIDAKLEQVKNLIKQCKEMHGDPEIGRVFDRIRDEIHDLVFLQVTDIALRRKRMLHDDSGIPQLFDDKSEIVFPWDIQADALELYNRWALRVFSVDLLRGIIKRPTTAGNRSTDRIDPAYPGKLKADYHGEGSLVNGQWWPTQLCTVRDGAHGSTQGGIYATKGKPAFSIVLSGGNHYSDRDEGEEIWYSGTDGKDGKPSENTQSLMLNISAGKPVRVIRSHNLTAGVHRPPRGFRYDGCYEVLSYTVLDSTKMSCLFHLTRKEGQDPIRSRGKEMRPTTAEIREYDKFKAEIEASERI